MKIMKFFAIWCSLVMIFQFCANYRAPSEKMVFKTKGAFTLISSSYFIGKNCVSATPINPRDKKLPVCHRGSRMLIGFISYTDLEDVTGADLESVGRELIYKNIATNNSSQVEL